VVTRDELGRGINAAAFVDGAGCEFSLADTGRHYVQGEMWFGNRDVLNGDWFISHHGIVDPKLVGRLGVSRPSGFANLNPHSLSQHRVETSKKKEISAVQSPL
jgi:hypothetical protein